MMHGRKNIKLNLETHEYKARVLTSQNDHCGWLDKTSVLYSGGSVFNCQLEDQLASILCGFTQFLHADARIASKLVCTCFLLLHYIQNVICVNAI